MIVLGSTGSIGKNTLSLAREFGIAVLALACDKNYKLLNEQIEEFQPKLVYIAKTELKGDVKHDKVFSGDIANFLESCANLCNPLNTTLINALVGFSGLYPSKVAQNFGFRLALANKESLVAGGDFLDTSAIFPVDSEHFGLKFLLTNAPCNASKLIITASGGAVAKIKNPKKIAKLRLEDALKHPNWSMGAKITIDSASMVNKLFEVLEAYHLYKIKNIEALIEKTSSIHAMVEFCDGSSTAHISKADMRLAIANALGLCGNFGSISGKNSRILENLLPKKIKFKKIDLEKYPAFGLKDELLKNPRLGVIVNAANDVIVNKYLHRLCDFGDISKTILKSFEKFCDAKIATFDEVIEMDKKVREYLK